jgi:cytochrome c556
MNRMTKILSVSLVAIAGFAVAQDAMEPMAAHEARVAYMKQMGAQMGVLGPMAQGEAPYDAAAAQAAADKLVELSATDTSGMWPEGSDSDTLAESRALPAIWTDSEGVMAKWTAFVAGATAMQAAAGVDLASLQAAMGGLGGACGSCHESYRKPSE